MNAKYQAMEPLLKRSLAIRERLLGKDHTDTLTILNDLMIVLMSLGDYKSAEPIARNIVEIRKRL